MLDGVDGYRHHVVHEDDSTVVFLAKYPQLWGHTLVAPKAHREQVVADFAVDEFLALQAVVHRVGSALCEVVATERLYVVSLGSQSANSHVHWHLLPLPPGVAYEDQQAAVFHESRGWIDAAEHEMADLAQAIAAAMAPVP